MTVSLTVTLISILCSYTNSRSYLYSLSNLIERQAKINMTYSQEINLCNMY